LPINVIVDAELHEGGSTSFTLVVLVVGEAGLFPLSPDLPLVPVSRWAKAAGTGSRKLT